MRAWGALRLAALAFLAGAVALAGWGLATGELQVALLLIFPLVYGTGWVATGVVLLLLGAMVSWFAAHLLHLRALAAATPEWERRGRAGEEPVAPLAPPERRVRHGGVVLIGPLPIVWGSDPRTTLWIVLATIALVVVAALVVWR